MPTPWPTKIAQRLDALVAIVAEQGDVARLGRSWLFSHPDAVRDLLVTHDRLFRKSPALRRAKFTLGNGLLTNDGPSYKQQRAIVQPALHPKSLGGYAAVMTRHAADAAAGWQDGQTVDLHRAMMQLTLRIVAETLFGTPIGPEAEAVSRAMDLNVAMFQLLTSPWGRVKVLLPTPFLFRFLTARRKLVGTLRRFIAQRRAYGGTHDDLLGRLLAARDGERGMSEKQLIDECVTLFAAGHETTANALTFTLWLLAQHPQITDRLLREIDAAVGHDRLPTMDDLPAMSYARMVVAESMRLYPPAWIMGRQARERCEFAGHVLRRGEVVFLSQWVVHRDPRWWPDPDRFDPERFNPANEHDRPRWAYFPFGGGSRLCVGESFAWAEVMFVLVTLVRQWRMTWDNPGPMPMEPSITLRPGREIRLRLHRR